jgi:hypothetical protein
VRTGFGVSRTGCGASACEISAWGGGAGVGTVAGAFMGSNAAVAATGAGAADCGRIANFIITAPPRAPAATKTTMCSGFIPSIPHNSQ